MRRASRDVMSDRVIVTNAARAATRSTARVDGGVRRQDAELTRYGPVDDPRACGSRGRPAGVDPRPLHGAGPRRGKRLHRAGDQHQGHGLRHGARRVRSAKKLDAGAFIFEIARSEIGYTEQRPAEYTSFVLAAALREGWKGPVFIQGDHFQINAKKFTAEREKELTRARADQRGHRGRLLQHRHRHLDARGPESRRTRSSRMNGRWPRTRGVHPQREPKGVTVSVGGEIGEVGGKNSTSRN